MDDVDGHIAAQELVYLIILEAHDVDQERFAPGLAIDENGLRAHMSDSVLVDPEFLREEQGEGRQEASRGLAVVLR
jgi:hypothetical protein